MKVRVIGKQVMDGVSKKSGKPYNATNVHVAFKDYRVEGESVEVVWIDSALCPAANIIVGETYNLERDKRGFSVAFDYV